MFNRNKELCLNNLHKRKLDNRCYKKSIGITYHEHCCACDNYYCFYPYMERNNGLFNFVKDKDQVLEYLLSNKIPFDKERFDSISWKSFL